VADKPVRKSIGAVALICRRAGGDLRWLVRWNRNWGCYHFVGGHKRDSESFAECARREIAEELGLRPEADFTVSPEAMQHLQYAAWSQRAKLDTEYTTELFAAVLRGKAADETVGRHDVRWIGAEEIRSGLCADGRPVSPTAVRLLDAVKWGGIPPSFEPA
jgi:8-oxo-dGTP pyrophosphatase MutT (NUDIX family)